MTAFLRQLVLLTVFPFFLAACGGGGGGGAGDPGTPPVSTAPGTPPTAPAPQPTTTLTSITLQSDQGDWIGQGKSYRYTPADAVITVTAVKNRIVFQVEGDEQWTGVVQTGGSATELKVGEYPALALYRENMDASQGALTWWGNGRSCTSSTGWAAIDNVVYTNGQLTSISLRFQRNCNGATAALRGTINYNVNDRTAAVPSPTSPPAGLWSPPATVAASQGNYAYFDSAEGDYVGLGKTYLFDRRSSIISATTGGYLLYINVAADDVWHAEIRGPSAMGRLTAGYYPGVKGARFNNPLKGGLSWTGAGRGCSESSGWFAIDAIAYDASGTMTRLDMRFEQHCEGRDAPLHGAIHYDSTPVASGSPAISAPGSWRAPAAALPASGNFLYVQSDVNEPLARGQTVLQTSANAGFEVSTDGNHLFVYGKGNHMWQLQFQPPAGVTQIVPGNYDKVAAWPSSTDSQALLYVATDSTGCTTQQGWVTVDSASYAGGKLVAIELRFEQQCTGGYNAPPQGLLHGHLRWRADVPPAFPGPAAVPELFWRPSATLPAGTYVYLSSDRSDFIGNGNALFTPVDSALDFTEKEGRLDIVVRGDTRWMGSFQTMSNAGMILPGYYAGLGNMPLRPARGSFTWGGDGRGCNTASSGVVVDKAVYAAGQLAELTMRFEQHCEDEPGALRGQIHWLASDTRQPDGPQTSVPADLWKAPPGALPASGNYLYVESPPGEPIGGGRTFLLTPNDGPFNVQAAASSPIGSGAFLKLGVDSNGFPGALFNLEFQAMSTVSQLQPGFYGHLMRYGFHNTAFGGLNASRLGLGCNSSWSWMALDKVVYTNGRLSAVHGRFEQYCDAAAVPLHGEFNWEG
jgi:hypothetical protein